jgi:2'-5' RNA ligase
VVQSVELLLEPTAEEAVLGVWRALLDAGLPSQARHTAPSNRPHVTLVAVPQIQAEDAVVEAVHDRLPVDATWGPVTFFGRGPWVLVRLLEPADGMRELQAAVATAVGVPGDSTSAPNHWRPHVTLARRVGPTARHAVAELAQAQAHTGMPVVAPAVRRWDGARRVEWEVGRAQT